MKKTEEENAFEEYWKYEQRTRPLKAFFEKGTIDSELKCRSFPVLQFYWIKALTCVFLNRTHGDYIGNTICVISYDEYQCYDSLSWRSVWVHKGILTGWKVCCSSDGT